MEIEVKTSADIIGLSVKRNKKQDGKSAFLDIEIGVKRTDAAKFGGDTFIDLAFSSMRESVDDDGAATVIHLQDKIKPGSKLTHPRHIIHIDGEVIKSQQPKLFSIRTIEGEAKVVATYRIPIPTAQRKLLASIVDKVGTLVAVEFAPEQHLMDLEDKPEVEA